MSAEKKDSSYLTKLPEDYWQVLLGYLSLKDFLSIRSTSKSQFGFFKTIHKEVLTQIALTWVVQGNLIRLKELLERYPEILFVKSKVTDPCGRTFYDVSPYQMMLFLCDSDMKNQISSLTGVKKYKEQAQLRKIQYAEINCGGADLVKLDFDPSNVCFEAITEFKILYTIDNETLQLSFPLLQNNDGILYYQNEAKKLHFYYANRKDEKITKLDPRLTIEIQEEWNAFKAAFNKMEPNSSRRSTNSEHQLIKKVLGTSLHRKGIHFEQNGKWYQDNCSAFNLIDAYRSLIRIKQNAEPRNNESINIFWREIVGKAQGEEIWLLQRICENSEFSSRSTTQFSRFERTFRFYNLNSGHYESALNEGKLVHGLALHKGGKGACGLYCAPDKIVLDLIAICRFVEEGRANSIEWDQEPNCNIQPF